MIRVYKFSLEHADVCAYLFDLDIPTCYRFEFNMTDSIATALFSYQCEGTEHNLSECSVGSSLCNVLNNRGSDIVAVACHQVL